MPTLPDRVYLFNPVIGVDADDTEGATPSFSVDTSDTIPVVVLGHAPSVGDYVTAYMVGGRWATEHLSSQSATCYSLFCAPCSIPKGNLTVSWVNGTSGNGSAVLVYSATPTPTWSVAGVDGGLTFTLDCNAGRNELKVRSGINLCSNLNTAPATLTLAASTCIPFSITFNVTNAGCPSVFGAGNTQFVVTGPNTSFGTCPVCFNVTSCGGPLPGATVTVLSGLTAIVSGTTDSTGNAILDIGTTGTYTVTVSGTDITTVTQTSSLSCGQSLAISVPIFLEPALTLPGCCWFCPGNTPETLTVTALGLTWALTLNWNGVTGCCRWYGETTYNWVGDGTCAPVAMTVGAVIYQGVAGGSTNWFIDFYSNVPSAFACPTGGSIAGLPCTLPSKGIIDGIATTNLICVSGRPFSQTFASVFFNIHGNAIFSPVTVTE